MNEKRQNDKLKAVNISKVERKHKKLRVFLVKGEYRKLKDW